MEAYDIGATIAQTLALGAPDRVAALALFNPAYPGIGECLPTFPRRLLNLVAPWGRFSFGRLHPTSSGF